MCGVDYCSYPTRLGVVMDKAAIQAKAEELRKWPVWNDINYIEAALTQTYEQGWNAAVEAAYEAVDKLPHSQYYHAPRKAIRRLRIKEE